MYQEENEKRRESVSSSDTPAYLPLRANYTSVLPRLFWASIKGNALGIALWTLKWLSLAALAISLVLGVLIVSNKNRCDKLLRFFRGDTTIQYERVNHAK